MLYHFKVTFYVNWKTVQFISILIINNTLRVYSLPGDDPVVSKQIVRFSFSNDYIDSIIIIIQ
jgi:hypothetical protein